MGVIFFLDEKGKTGNSLPFEASEISPMGKNILAVSLHSVNMWMPEGKKEGRESEK